ncbi:MAG: bifunctional methylenetetrahydrofolate dehydrogenase/methenyltetrahydrofolate cyclohydrolase FolD [Alphaproteobacteria bacterium]|nr:bifunctional methylenetetrahydrofolate dehydrogenase/methenyltetrahydrofolate cyclohydrolase FolD [Alphaproteobacteria bacterium]
MPETHIIDGKAIAAELTDDIARQTTAFTHENGAPPCLAVILVGDDAASAVYVRNKGRTAAKVGFRSIQETLPADVADERLTDLVKALDADDSVHGILVQLPLPAHIDEAKLLELISPEKDVDGFHPVNVGRLASGQTDGALTPCTPAGSVMLAKSYLGNDLSGIDAIVVGRSNIVGKPAAQLLLAENCTVTIAHSRTTDLKSKVLAADLVVAAVGRPEMIRGDWIKPGACVIDVGINRVGAPDLGAGKTRLVGDVAFAEAIGVAGAITPVPGGVGPMTIAMLMANTLKAAKAITTKSN